MRKLMKKTAALLMAAAMAASMMACGKSPEEIFNEASAKSAEMKDIDMDMSMVISMAVEEVNMDINMDMNLKASDMNTEEMLYLAEGKVGVAAAGAEQAMDMKTFYADGYCYTETMGEKIKYAMDLESMMETVAQNNMASTGMKAEDMLELEMTKDGDNKVFTFTADPEKINDTMAASLSSMTEQLGTDAEVKITGITGVCTVNKDGYYTNMTMNMTYEMTMMGMTLTATGDVETTLNNPGAAVEVTLPDTEGYTEVEM